MELLNYRIKYRYVSFISPLFRRYTISTEGLAAQSKTNLFNGESLAEKDAKLFKQQASNIRET